MISLFINNVNKECRILARFPPYLENKQWNMNIVNRGIGFFTTYLGNG